MESGESPTSSLSSARGLPAGHVRKATPKKKGNTRSNMAGGGGGADPLLVARVYPHDIAAHALNSGGRSPGPNPRQLTAVSHRGLPKTLLRKRLVDK